MAKKPYKKPSVKTRKAGRPKLMNERIPLVIHVPKALKQELVKSAKKQDLPISAFCRGVLAGRLKAVSA